MSAASPPRASRRCAPARSPPRCGTIGFHAINHWIDVNDAHAGSDAGITDTVLLTLLALLIIAPLRAAIAERDPR